MIIKTWTVPHHPYDRNVLFDIFNEISVLDHFRLQSSVTKLLDFGASESDYFIILAKYPYTLKAFRNKSSEKEIPLWLNLYL